MIKTDLFMGIKFADQKECCADGSYFTNLNPTQKESKFNELLQVLLGLVTDSKLTETQDKDKNKQNITMLASLTDFVQKNYFLQEKFTKKENFSFKNKIENLKKLEIFISHEGINAVLAILREGDKEISFDGEDFDKIKICIDKSILHERTTAELLTILQDLPHNDSKKTIFAVTPIYKTQIEEAPPTIDPNKLQKNSINDPQMQERAVFEAIKTFLLKEADSDINTNTKDINFWFQTQTDNEITKNTLWKEKSHTGFFEWLLINSGQKKPEMTHYAKGARSDNISELLINFGQKELKDMFKYSLSKIETLDIDHSPKIEKTLPTQILSKQINVDFEPEIFIGQDKTGGNTVFISSQLEFEELIPHKERDLSNLESNISKEQSPCVHVVHGQTQKNERIQTSNSISNKVDHKSILEQIIKKIEVQLQKDKQEITIDLKPEFLGKLKVHVSMERGFLKIHFLTTTPSVKEAIESGFNILKQNFGQQGFLISEFSVSLANEHSKFHMPKNEKQNSHTYGKKEKREKVDVIRFKNLKKNLIDLKTIDFWA